MTGAFPVPLTLPVANGLFQPLDADLTSWAAITRGANFDTFAATPSLSNLNLLIGSTMLTSGGALGTPSSGTVTNLTGTASININGTVGATTPNTGSFTILGASGAISGTDATDATSSTAAALKTAGGLAVAKKLYVGTSINIPGATSGTATMTAGASNSGFVFSATPFSNSGAYGLIGVGWISGSSNGRFQLTATTATTGAISRLTFGTEDTSTPQFRFSGTTIIAGLGNATDGGAFVASGTLAASGPVTEGGSAAGAATTQTRLVKAVASIADNTATTVLTITIPNAAHSGSLRVRLIGAMGAGGAVGAREATASIEYDISITRTAGAPAVASISTAYGSASSSVAGGDTMTIVGTIAHGGEGTGVSNTYLVKATIDASGAATNHTCQVIAEIANAAATGITVTIP